MYVDAVFFRVQKRASDPFEMELQTFVTCLVGSSARAVSTFNP